jgi:uncharacterized membrane protein YbhN (UPF0104 family)/tRNA A-37 threonylcarbamoyl transferase component Bud32
MADSLRTTDENRPASSPRLLAAVAPRRWAPSFFGVVPKGGVRRRPTDVVRLGVALLLVTGCYIVTDGFTAREDNTYQFLSELPGWLGTAGTWLFVGCTVGAVAVVVAALLLTRNFRLALTLVAVGVATGAAAVALAGVLDVEAFREAAGIEAGSLSAGSVVWLAVATAVLLTAAPYLVRPARHIVRSVQVLAVIGAVMAAVGPLGSVLGALGVGWATSALVSLVVGTPKATPTITEVVGALDDLGVDVSDLELADDQTWGETRFVGRDPDDRPVSVVVIGRDATDARLLHKLWRSLMYRDAGPSISVGRSAQLEHRAYLLLLAAKVGVPVSEVVIAARAGPGDTALLVLLDPPGHRLADLDADQITDGILDDLWANLSRLHRARLSHGQLVPANVVVRNGGSTAFVDFSHGSAGAPPERCQRDRVEVLATSAVLIGDDRALDAAVRSLRPDGVAELLPLLESAALSTPARRAIPDRNERMKSLREAAAATTGHEVPKLAELRRVSPASVVMAAATFLGFYLIIEQFVGVDLASTLAEAQWRWVVLAFVLSLVPQFTGAIALQGAVATPLPFGPVLAEQFANNFTGLIGGTVATTALVIRFFQKRGLQVAVAASSGVMNSLASGIAQFVLVTIGLLLSDTSFAASSVGGGDAGRIIVIGILIIGVAVGISLLIPRLRGLLRRTIGPEVAAGRDNLRGILSEPRKALMLFGGNLGSQLAYALVLGVALRAYGTSLPLVDLIVINSLASLLGGMAPVPGGMGVIEAGLIGGMTAAGVPESIAVTATFTARLFTAYLPPIWGWVSLQWLRRHDYV